jgi:hypothetical protein
MGGGFNRLLATATLLFLSALLGVAMAQPPSNADPLSPLGRWYRSLMIPNTGSSCCSAADCRPVEARLAGDRWEVHGDHGWLAVPPDAILRRDNPDGRPIACLHSGIIFCFVPPPAT